ncbi:TonB-dependent receptor [Sphingomonas sabuli]|uniref:TonB-dependent receptor n=1 Tax=Sphingomonas sabuli TaxID=2764186 RepID=A0A7G9L1X5_9SPHN|nr:TonB-dependent receptor [Sphingomonas sabuli]QNM82624.1 TonB-dependent receptor [Sphingomonas sabuli]
MLRWRPSDRVEVNSFYGNVMIPHDRNMPLIFTGGAYLPPKVERRYFGLDWTISKARRHFFGSLATVALSYSWQVRGGLFRWENVATQLRTELYRNVQPDGSANRTVVASEDASSRSTSGEARLSHTRTEGGRRHTIHVTARGRATRRNYGPTAVVDLGPASIATRVDAPEPEFLFGADSDDHIRQLTGGIGYEGRWPGVGELSLGVQKANYEKVSNLPGLSPLVTKDDPWLINGTVAAYLTPKLVAYAGYTRGLEESGTAPANAVNRNSAPPALRTSQRDAGIRYTIAPGVNFVAGLFDVRKPYFTLDPDRVYRQLGTVRHRGIELSLAGQPAPGLTVIGGAVLLDAEVSGEAVSLGVIGPKPVGIAGRTLRFNADYRLPFFAPLSIDLGLNNRSSQAAGSQVHEALGGEQLTTGPKTTVDIGARYRFKLAAVPAVLRVQVTNLFDSYAWDAASNGSLRFSDTRRVAATLAADF